MPVGVGKADAVFHYRCAASDEWRENVPSWSAVVYRRLYPGVDLRLTGRPGGLKYEFVVAPGADWHQVRVRYTGIETLRLLADGSLEIHFGKDWAPLADAAPLVYQEAEGSRRTLSARFVLVDSTTCGFEIAGAYDPTLPLVLDPEILWSTYLGGIDQDRGTCIAIDPSGNVIVGGSTMSGGWVSGGYHTDWKPYVLEFASDGFIAKLSPDGQHLWSTYLGGDGEDRVYGVVTDNQGNVFATGSTALGGWVSGGGDVTHNGGGLDALVVKLTGTGAHVWSTYLGGDKSDIGWGIARLPNGSVVVAGQTSSGGWTTSGTYQGGGDAFVARLTEAGALSWARCYGGTGTDIAYAIAVDPQPWPQIFPLQYGVVIAGSTASSGWVTGGADLMYGGAGDGFVVQLSSSAGGVVWSSYLGGAGADAARAVAIAFGSSDILLAGSSNSSDWPPRSCGQQAAFLARLTSAGAHRWAPTLHCGYAHANAVLEDPLGNVHFAGGTSAEPTVGQGFVATQKRGEPTSFVAVGGAGGDHVAGLAMDGVGSLVAAGTTQSAGWTAGGFDTSYGGFQDAFVAKLAYAGAVSVTLDPPAANTAGAQWRVLGTTHWHTTGETEGWLTPGTYIVEFRSIDGWSNPEALSVIAAPGSTARLAASYVPYSSTQAQISWSTFLGAPAHGLTLDSVEGIVVYGQRERVGFVSKLTTDGGCVFHETAPPADDMDLDSKDFIYLVGHGTIYPFSGGWIAKYRQDAKYSSWVLTPLGNISSVYVQADDTLLCSGWDVGREVLYRFDSNGFILGYRYVTEGEIAMSPGGYVYVAGAVQSDAGDYDGILQRLNPIGDLAGAFYLDGSDADFARDATIDNLGNIIVVGSTKSVDIAGNPVNAPHGDFDAFVVKLTWGGTKSQLWITYIGGPGLDGASGVATDGAGNVYVTGYTESAGWVAGGPDISYNGNRDGFAAKLDPDGVLLWSTYLGGGGADECKGDIAVDSAGAILVSGMTESDGWIRQGYNTTHNGSADGFVVKIRDLGLAQGVLRVELSPHPAVASGAQWRRTGTTEWRNSGTVESGLAPGQYTIEFKPVAGWAEPASQSVAIQPGQTTTATATYVFRAPGSLQCAEAASSVFESAGTATITVTRTGGSSGAVGISWAASNGTATGGQDYTLVFGTRQWVDGDAEPKTFEVPILPDVVQEQDETLMVTLSNPTGGATLGSPSTVTLTIVDDDAPIDRYSLVLTVTPIGAGTVSATPAPGTDAKYAPGTVVALTAVANAGYRFTRWSGHASGALNPVQVTMNGNRSVIANFEGPGVLQFAQGVSSVNESAGTATVAVTRTGGSSGAVDVNYTTGNGTATAGADYTAASGTLHWANGDALFKTFTVPIIADTVQEADETILLTLSNPTAGATLGRRRTSTLTIMDDDVSVNRFSLALEVSPEDAGTISASPAPDGDGKYADGTVVTLTVVPSPGYTFRTLSGDLDAGNPFQVTMNANKRVTASFIRTRFQLTLNLPPDARVEVHPKTSDGRFDAGTVVTLLASTRQSCTEFAYWSGDLSGSANPAQITMDSDKNITPHYALSRYPVIVDVSPPGAGSVAISPSSPDGKYECYGEVTLTATPAAGYVFSRWVGADPLVNPVTVWVKDNMFPIQAVFTPLQYRLTLIVNPPQAGLIRADPPPGTSGTYDWGTVVSLWPSPGNGWSFVGWSGDVSSPDATVEVTLDGDKTVMASFVPDGPPLPSVTVANFGFEEDVYTVFPGYDWQNTPITGWVLEGTGGINPVLPREDPANAPFANNGVIPEGVQVAFLQMDTQLKHTIQGLAKGGTYRISYAENAREGDDPGDPSIEVRIGETVIVTRHGVVPVGGMNLYHRIESQPFVATGTEMILTFDARGEGGANSVVLDDVHVVGLFPAPITPTLTLGAMPAAGGTISASPPPGGDGNYAAGTVVTLTATASTGYEFRHWSGDAVGSVNPVTVTMDRDRNVGAVFWPSAAVLCLDFEGAIPQGVSLEGSARLEGGVVHLTDAVNEQEGSLIVASDHAWAGFRAAFLALIGDGSQPPADGLSFSFGSDVEGAFGEEGWGTGLIVAFDTYLNDGDVAPAIEIKWCWQTVALVKVPLVKYEPARFVGIQVELTAGGAVSVCYDGELIHDGVQIPDYVPVTGNARFGIGGRTGGYTSRHWVDDLCIEELQATGGYRLALAANPTGAGIISADPPPNGDGKYAAGTVVTLTASARFGYLFGHWTGAASGTDLTTTVTISGDRTVNATFSLDPDLLAGLQRQLFLDLPGNTIGDLTRAGKYPDAPDLTDAVLAVESQYLPDNAGEYYGQRLSGYLVAQASGEHTFYLASDDAAQLYLSPDEKPENRQLVTEETGWNAYRNWEGQYAAEPIIDWSTGEPFPQRSGSRVLEQGRLYYIEVLHKEGNGGDHLGVAWKLPGGAVPVNGSEPIGSGVSVLVHQSGGIPVPSVLPPELPGVAPGIAGSWNIRMYRESGFDSRQLADAVDVIKDNRGVTTDGTANVINHWDPESGLCDESALLFGTKIPFPGDIPGLAEDGLVLLAKATVSVPEAGDYTFGVQSDDGFGLRVNGARFVSCSGSGQIDPGDPQVLYFSEGTCNSNTRGVCHFEAAGPYVLELVYYECWGPADIEFYWAKGAFQNNGDTTAWELVQPTSPAGPFVLDLTLHPTGAGIISADPPPNGDGKYAAGTVVTLTATPIGDYGFAGWEGDVGGWANPVSLTMNTDKVVFAWFAPLSLFVTVVNPGFEADTFTVWPGYVWHNGPIAGWTSEGGMGVNPVWPFGEEDHPFADNGTMPEGKQVGFLQQDGQLWQLIHGLAPGATYRVDYAENARMGGIPSLEVRMGGTVIVARHEVLPVGGVNAYRRIWSEPFVATDASMALAFSKSGPAGSDMTVLLDDVHVVGIALPLELTCSFPPPGQGGQLTLEWDPGMTGLILETTESLSPPIIWTPVPGVAGNSATLPLTKTAAFYRLRR